MPQRTKDFKGGCLGVRLLETQYGIEIKILIEDDDNWFVSSNSGFNSFWLPDLVRQLNDAKAWMKRNCEPYMDKGIQYGWRFKGA